MAGNSSAFGARIRKRRPGATASFPETLAIWMPIMMETSITMTV
jgi:hypothetical protein